MGIRQVARYLRRALLLFSADRSSSEVWTDANASHSDRRGADLSGRRHHLDQWIVVLISIRSPSLPSRRSTPVDFHVQLRAGLVSKRRLDATPNSCGVQTR